MTAAPRRAQITDVSPNRTPADRVEPLGRVVEKNDRGSVPGAPGDLELRDHAAAMLPQQTVANLGKAHQLERVTDAALAFSARHQIEARAEQHVFIACELAGDREQVRDMPDVPAHLLGLRAQIEAGDRCAAIRRRQHRRQHLVQGALARAIGAMRPMVSADQTESDAPCTAVSAPKRRVSPNVSIAGPPDAGLSVPMTVTSRPVVQGSAAELRTRPAHCAGQARDTRVRSHTCTPCTCGNLTSRLNRRAIVPGAGTDTMRRADPTTGVHARRGHTLGGLA